MSIEVVCQNGHALKVKNSLAGKTGVCPVCKVKVKIPGAAAPVPPGGSSELTEDAILDMIGPYEPDQARIQAPIEEEKPARKTSGREGGPVPPKKTCLKCNAEIPAGTHICPVCRTYLTPFPGKK